MRKTQKFFICKHCGSLLGLIDDKGVPMLCCGENMTELIPNTVEASTEKHLPVIKPDDSRYGICVQVGSEPHPMEEDHHISFIYVETIYGGQRKYLEVDGDPEISFVFTTDSPLAVYAYCNLHGLWKTEIKQ